MCGGWLDGVKSERGEPVEPLNRVFREIYEIRADKVGNKSKSLKDVAPKKGKSSWDGSMGEEWVERGWGRHLSTGGRRVEGKGPTENAVRV